MYSERGGYVPKQEKRQESESDRLEEEVKTLLEHGSLQELARARHALERNTAMFSIGNSEISASKSRFGGNVSATLEHLQAFHRRVKGGETPEQIVGMARKNIEVLKQNISELRASLADVPQYQQLEAAEARLAEIRSESESARMDALKQRDADAAPRPVVDSRSKNPMRNTVMGVDIWSQLTEDQRKLLGRDEKGKPTKK